MQARNDLVQIVTAVNAYYAEYGKYPPLATPRTQPTAQPPPRTHSSSMTFGSSAPTQNPREIVFLSPPDAKDANNPRAGISSAPARVNTSIPGETVPDSHRHGLRQSSRNPYSQNAGSAPLLRSGVIAWSFGKDALSQSTSNASRQEHRNEQRRRNFLAVTRSRRRARLTFPPSTINYQPLNLLPRV